MDSQIENDLNRMQAAAQAMMDTARRLEDRRRRGLLRIQRYPLWFRLIMFWRLTKMRAIVHQQAMARSHLVMMSLGMTRRVKLIRRKISRDEEL
jgi:hypothetical protein